LYIYLIAFISSHTFNWYVCIESIMCFYENDYIEMDSVQIYISL